MKFSTIISVIFFIALGIVANIYFLKFSTLQFIGFMLLAFIILGVAVNFFVKANRKRKGVQGEPDAFIFPDKTAKTLKTIDLEIQYEASVLSSALLMLGILLFMIYFCFFTNSLWIMKGFVIFNSLCGLGLMGGMLVTYFQQLVSYRESIKFLTDFSSQQPQQQDLYGEELYQPEEESYEEPYDNTNERREYK